MSAEYDALVARVAELEARAIQLHDLPLSDLQRHLETKWQPNASILLQPGTITPDLIAP